MKYFAIAVLLIMATVIGCKDDEQKGKSEASFPPYGGVVVAKIGDRVITKVEVMQSMDLMNPRRKALYLSSPDLMLTFVTDYVNREMLYQQALKEGIDQSERFKANIEQHKKELLIRVITNKANPVQVSKESLQAYYDEHKDDMVMVKALEATVIAYPTTNVTMENAKAMANEIKQRADRGEDFREIAADVLQDNPSRQKEARFTSIWKGKRSPEIDDIIFSLGDGEISEPIELPNGYMVIKIEKAAIPVPLQSVKTTIRIEIRKNTLNEYMASLKEQLNVEIYEGAMKEFAPQISK